MNKIKRLTDIFRSKKDKADMKKQLKDISSDFEDIVWSNEVLYKASMLTITISSLVLAVIILKSMYGTITLSSLIIFCGLLFSVNFIMVCIMWTLYKKELKK